MTEPKSGSLAGRTKALLGRLEKMNEPPAPDANALLDHFADTYFSLRLGLAVLAPLFPLALWFVGACIYGLGLQPSMSAYYWATGAQDGGAYAMRAVFVGFLCAIGAGLFLYKGLTKVENRALNVAGLCAVMVALFPTGKSSPPGESFWAQATMCTAQGCPGVHYGAAVVLFVLLAYVAWACAHKSLDYLPERMPIKPRWKWLKLLVGGRPVPSRKTFERAYHTIAMALLSVLVIGLGCYLLEAPWASWLFWVEAAGITVFGLYWLVKTVELSMSQPERDPARAAARAREAR